MQVSSNLAPETKPFELRAWALLTCVACARILKDILQDLFNGNSEGNLLIDVPLLLVFVLLLLLIVTKKISAVPLWVGIVLLLLTIWSYVRLGGVQGTSEYNLMALGVMFALCYRGRDLAISLTAFVTMIVLANLDKLQHGRITQLLYKMTSDSDDSFYSTLIVIGIVLLYFKELLKVETSKVRHARELLGRQRSVIQKQHDELSRQQNVLMDATKSLGYDVQRFDDVIKVQDAAIRDYIFLSTQNLRLSMTRMSSVPKGWLASDHLAGRLRDQIDELNTVVANLITELENPDHDRLD